VRVRKDFLYRCQRLAQRPLDGGARLPLCDGDRLIVASAKRTGSLAQGLKSPAAMCARAMVEGLRADRERALLCVAYDTMARRSELVAFDLEDVEFMPNGSGTLLIRRSKTDTAGEGARTYLSHDTVKWLRRWLQNSGIEDGAIFRRLIGQNRVGDRLHADIVADIYKRVARWIGMAAKQVNQVSGHSVRVGAAQDLLALNIDLASIMQAGR
jgi:integrase